MLLIGRLWKFCSSPSLMRWVLMLMWIYGWLNHPRIIYWLTSPPFIIFNYNALCIGKYSFLYWHSGGTSTMDTHSSYWRRKIPRIKCQIVFDNIAVNLILSRRFYWLTDFGKPGQGGMIRSWPHYSQMNVFMRILFQVHPNLFGSRYFLPLTDQAD